MTLTGPGQGAKAAILWRVLPGEEQERLEMV
jgi:hypothetical protein